MKLLKTLLILSGTFLALTAFAAEGYELKVALPGITGADTNISSLSGYIVLMYRFSFLIGGLLAIGIIVYNSIMYTISAGNSGMQGEAKDGILHALYGLGLLAGTFLILNTINPDLVNLKDPGLDIPRIPFKNLPKPKEDIRKKFVEESEKYILKSQQAEIIKKAQEENNQEILSLQNLLTETEKEISSGFSVPKNELKRTTIQGIIQRIALRNNYIASIQELEGGLGTDEGDAEILQYRKEQLATTEKEIATLRQQLNLLK